MQPAARWDVANVNIGASGLHYVQISVLAS